MYLKVPFIIHFTSQALEKVHQMGNKQDKNKIKWLLLKALMITGDNIKNSLLSNSPLKELLQGEDDKVESTIDQLPFSSDFPHSCNIFFVDSLFSKFQVISKFIQY